MDLTHIDSAGNACMVNVAEKAITARKGMFDVAKNLLGLGVPVDTIVKSTGLIHEDVESLRQ